MNLVVSSDEKTPLTDFVIHYLKSKGHTLTLLGDLQEKNGKWAEIATQAAKLVANKTVDQGILFCWSGTGTTMAANRIQGVRAALCWTPEIAKLARKWNDANVLVMALVNTTNKNAKEMIDAWFSTSFDEEGLNEAHKLDEI
ncbi:MAG: RpiB/LacA/LacB family sugar-phosphate isomerase [Candidatus Pacebacteria bacterium]|nr:RpiB/LacA/LacB family sugar-phosphate isomerase [Candidatus Paceibacterota bacterium]